MKLKVLVDNNTTIDQYYCGEPGACYYIEDEGVKLLLDTGYSSLFLANGHALGVDLTQVDGVIFSHGHNDHVGGFPYLLDLWKNQPEETDKPKKKHCLVCHPLALEPKMEGGESIGVTLSKEEIAGSCRVILTKDPLKLSNNITFLGEIPRVIEEGGRMRAGSQEEPFYDRLLDDSAVVYRGREGIYVITGCSHSGICNIIERAKQVTGVDRVEGVIGGFHLFDPESDSAKQAIDYLKKQEIPHLYPCHCVSLAVKCALYNQMPIGDVGVGLELDWQ